MKIFEAKRLFRLLNEKVVNGHYVMQDASLYRIMGWRELYDMLTNKHLAADAEQEGLPLDERHGSVIYDLSTENDTLDKYATKENPLRRRVNIQKKYMDGFFKSFARSINPFLMRNFMKRRNNTAIVEFNRDAIKALRDSRIRPFRWLPDAFHGPNDFGTAYSKQNFEIEDRLYFPKSTLPFTKPINYYIKAIYVSPKIKKVEVRKNVWKLDEDSVKLFQDITALARKNNIDFRIIDSKDKAWQAGSPLALRSLPSTHEELAKLKIGKEPDDKNSPEYHQWARAKKRKERAQEQIGTAHPLTYLHRKVTPR